MAIRKTVTLDPDVAEQLRELARSRNVSFKIVLNDMVRKGLAAERGDTRPFEVQSRPMGLRPDIDLTHALEIAAALEDEEIIRKHEGRG